MALALNLINLPGSHPPSTRAPDATWLKARAFLNVKHHTAMTVLYCPIPVLQVQAPNPSPKLRAGLRVRVKRSSVWHVRVPYTHTEDGSGSQLPVQYCYLLSAGGVVWCAA